MQVLLQNRLIRGSWRAGHHHAALAHAHVLALAFLQRLPARVIGMGFRPEHVRTTI